MHLDKVEPANSLVELNVNFIDLRKNALKYQWCLQFKISSCVGWLFFDKKFVTKLFSLLVQISHGIS